LIFNYFFVVCSFKAAVKEVGLNHNKLELKET